MNKEQLNKVNLLNQEDSIIKQDYSEEPKKNNLIKLIITSIIVLIALIGGYFIYQYYFNQPIEEEQPITCSEETKTCPDGTTVVRIPPDCEFAECLEYTDPTADWKTYRNEEYGFELKYPKDWMYSEAITTESLFIKNVIGFKPEDKTYSFMNGAMDPIIIEVFMGTIKQISENMHPLLKTEPSLSINSYSVFFEENALGELSYFFQNPKNNNIQINLKSEIDMLLKNQPEKVAEKDELKNIFNQILSTFKFID